MSDSPEDKFDYLQAKYIFRFPFTTTAIKWGVALGTFMGVHQYIKSRSLQNSIRWFVWGNLLTGLPIWGFFMMKYSFYSQAIRKFEIESEEQTEQTGLTRAYIVNKLQIRNDLKDDELIKLYEERASEIRERYSLLDELLKDVDFGQFE